MYLRLKKRALKRLSRTSIDAVILESRRNGSTTVQRFIAYLGSIRENHIEHVRPRIVFWDKVFKKFDLIHMPSDIRRIIEDRLAEHIARPTDDERAWYLQRLAEIEAKSKRKINTG